MLIILIIITGALIGIMPDNAYADVTFEARVDRTHVMLEEPITYTLEISGEGGSIPEPSLPAMNAFDVYSSGRTKSINIVNTQMSTSIIFNYVLVPKKAGTFTIAPAGIAIDGKVYKTDPITIAVAAPKATSPSRRSGGQGETPSTSGRTPRLDVEAELDRDTVYVNQCVTLSFRFYRGERLLSSPGFTPPSMAGYQKEDLPPQRKYYRDIGGVRYDVTEIQTALFPISAGEKTIDAFRLVATVEDRSRQRLDPFSVFNDDFFSPFRHGKKFNLTTQPLKLVVLPLPAQGRPADFSGLVGSFDITTRYDRFKVVVNEPITARVTISGRGNIKSITEPKVTAPPDFRLYNAGSTENVSKAGYQVSGEKTFEEVFVPRRVGTYELPAFTLTYFDPDRRQYISRRTPPVTVTVTPGEGEFSIPPLATEANDIGYLAKDIRFLKGGGGPFARQAAGFPYVLFGLLHMVPLVGLGVVIMMRRYQNRLESDVAYRRARYAGKTARRRFGKAKKSADAGNAGEFYPAVSAALADFFGDRFNRSGKGLTRTEIAETFARSRIDSGLQQEFIAVLDICDQARFAPGASGAESIRELFERAVKVLERLDKALASK